MVDVDKDRIHKRKEPKSKNSRFPKIDLKSLIIGAVIFLFFPVAAYKQNIDVLTALAAVGPLYIGYKAQTKLKGLILGAVSAIPLLYAASIGGLGPITATDINSFNTALIVMCVSILGIGALVGLLGGYLYQSRAKAKAEYEAKKPAGSKNRPIKEDKKPKTKKKLEDTGSVKQNIVNLFKPRR
ncbi:MAG: YrzE family protein [archaeon]|nr:YrzE family protein [archaeon]